MKLPTAEQVSSEPLNGHLFAAVLSLSSGCLCCVAFLIPDYYWLMWFALVPLLMAVDSSSPLRGYSCGLLFGFVFCCSSAYWAADFFILFKAYNGLTAWLLSCVFWIYSAQLFALFCGLYRYLKNHSGVSELVLFPVVFVATVSMFPMLFPFQLAGSQSQFLVALQALDLFGVYGLDAMICLVNVLIFRLFVPATGVTSKLHLRLAASVVCIWFSYGFIALKNGQFDTVNSLTVGIVQPNETAQQAKLKLLPGFSTSYPPELEMSKRLTAVGAKLVIWPETRYKGFVDSAPVQKSFRQFVGDTKSYLLFQDMAHLSELEQAGSSAKLRNSAIFLSPSREEEAEYHKIKPMPFAEYIPLVNQIPGLSSIVKNYFGDFSSEIKPGKAHQVFELDNARIVPLICYETMFSFFVANAVASQSATMLVGLSNDGWFGQTQQPYQHGYASSLRAVENRLPFVHVLNNGPSMLTLPSGKTQIIGGYYQAGGFIVEVPLLAEKGGSFYSRQPYLFITLVWLVLGFILAKVLFGRMTSW